MPGPDFTGLEVKARRVAVQGDPTTGRLVLVELINPGGAGGDTAAVRMGVSGDPASAELILEAVRPQTNAGVDFVVWQSDGNGVLQERLRITEEGKVGLGKPNPVTKVHIGGANSELSFDGFGAGQRTGLRGYAGDTYWRAGWYNDGGNQAGFRITVPNGDINRYFDVAGVDSGGNVQAVLLRVRADGNIGIGVTNPSEKLDVNGSVNVPGTVSGGVPSYGYKRNGALLGRGLSLVVAASNATDAEKAGADYICSGSEDQLVIQQAINALYSSPHGGGTLQLTSGTFNLTSPILIWKLGATADVTKPVHLVGVGRGATVLRASTPLIDAIQVGFLPDTPQQSGIKHWYVTIQGLSIDSPVDANGDTIKTAGAGIWFMNTVRCAVYDVEIDHQFYGIRLGQAQFPLMIGASQLILQNIGIHDTKPGTGVAVLVDSLSDFSMARVLCTNGWPGSDPLKRPKAAIQLTHADGVDIHNCDFVNFIEVLLINPGSSQYVQHLFCESTNFDVNTNAGIRFAPTGDGYIRRVFVTDCWIASSSNKGVSIDDMPGPDRTSNIFFSGCFILNNANRGIHIGKNSNYVQVVGCHILAPGGNSNEAAIRLETDTDYVQIKNNYIGYGHGAGSFGVGIAIIGGSSRWSVVGNTIADHRPPAQRGKGISFEAGTHTSFVLLGNDLTNCPIYYDPAAQLQLPYELAHNLEGP